MEGGGIRNVIAKSIFKKTMNYFSLVKKYSLSIGRFENCECINVFGLLKYS